MTTANAARLRHPEKRNKPDNPIQRKPGWIRVKAPTSKEYAETRDIVRENGLHTVCEEAACPNIGECWAKRHATFMIMGDTCTRACAFCNVATGMPRPLDPMEPVNVAAAVAKLGLEHVVVTSVDRDDLADGGGEHFAQVIENIKEMSPGTTIEVLTPDFMNKDGAIERVVDAQPDVFNHNIETVPRLYPGIRPGARYFTSLELLNRVKRLDPAMFTKSGLMVGLGENKEEVAQVMDDLRAADVDFIRFEAAAKQRIVVNSVARRADSPMDTVVTVYDPAGRVMGSSGDNHHGDSLVDFVVRAEGDGRQVAVGLGPPLFLFGERVVLLLGDGPVLEQCVEEPLVSVGGERRRRKEED